MLYALKVVKVGPFEVCAGWLVNTRPPEAAPSFYVGPCKKNYQTGNSLEVPPTVAPSASHGGLR